MATKDFISKEDETLTHRRRKCLVSQTDLDLSV